jgi:hypothetical protein
VDLFVALSSFVFILVGTAVGVRIIRRSRRDHSLPELAVGVALVAFAGVTQPLAILRVALTGQIPLAFSAALQIASTLGSALTVFALYVFTWRVFRPDARWAVLVFAGGSAIGIWSNVGLAVFYFYDAALSPAFAGRWVAVSAASYGICFGWASIESLTYWTSLRRRLRIGLADPLVVNRFLLWGGACAFGVAVDVWVGALALAGVDFGTEPLPRLLVAASGLVNATAWWLGFTPPGFYARWIRRRRRAKSASGR